MTKDLFTQQQYNIIGVGGLKCYCCNEYHGKNKNKLNRIKRRKLKECMNKEVVTT
jgi:hypothetical protein